jgi:hypothetical protein
MRIKLLFSFSQIDFSHIYPPNPTRTSIFFPSDHFIFDLLALTPSPSIPMRINTRPDEQHKLQDSKLLISWLRLSEHGNFFWD